MSAADSRLFAFKDYVCDVIIALIMYAVVNTLRLAPAGLMCLHVAIGLVVRVLT